MESTMQLPPTHSTNFVECVAVNRPAAAPPAKTVLVWAGDFR